MSLETNLRFEMMTNNESLHAALRRQKERIENDEMMAAREKQAKIEAGITLRSDWNEGLQVKSEGQRMRSAHATRQAELKMAQKAFIAVRREAMKKLLNDEYRQYEQELNKTGKAFYIKRE